MRARARAVSATALFLSMASACGAAAATAYLVHTPAEYATAAAALRPGDVVTLADGEWADFQVLFKGEGTAAAPITLTAQTPGQVVLTGQSNLRLAGRHLTVSNLVFRDGWSPTDSVVSFRESSKARATDSRVTGVVIDGFSKPDRTQSDNWVQLYGQDNRFDHNQIAGKSNAGPTVVVVRDATQGLDNRHQIDHNWFGPRPNLGANGGETLRVGTSTDSLSDSHTTVDHNWFEECDGEVEIVSNKSGANLYRGNVFYRSRGALVLRHGSGNLVEANVFLGDGKSDTGGVRVINADQTVRNNYFEGLAGKGLSSALSVMYGVPDSPINRYHPVVNATIENNTFVAPASLFFGAGKDDERTVAPTDSRFRRNLIVNGASEPLRVLGDLSGIAFSGNVQSPLASTGFPGGVDGRTVTMQRADTGLLVPADLPGVGADPALAPIPREQTGVAWYPKTLPQVALDRGARRPVAPGEDTLTAALAASAPGDRLALAAGDYRVHQVLAIDRPLTVQGPRRGSAVITFSRPTLFEIRPGGDLRLSALTVSGRDAPDAAGNAVIRPRPGGSAANYRLILENVQLRELHGNPGFDVIHTGKDSLADLIELRGVRAEDISGSVLAAAAETDDHGTYNAEQVRISHSRFRRIDGPAVDLYRGGTDESTFGPRLEVAHSQFERVGARAGASLRLRGVQQAELTDNRFVDSAGVQFTHRVGEPRLLAARNELVGTPAIQSDIRIEAAQ